jgi:hypothetical protein
MPPPRAGRPEVDETKLYVAGLQQGVQEAVLRDIFGRCVLDRVCVCACVRVCVCACVCACACVVRGVVAHSQR